MQRGERKVWRDVPDLLDALGYQGIAAFSAQPGQFVEAMFGANDVARAVRVVRTRVRLEAVIARPNIRWRTPLDHLLHLLNAGDDGIQKRLRLIQNGMQLEQRVEVEPFAVVDIVPIQSEDAGCAHIESGAAQNAELNGNIEDEDILEPCSGLDLDQPPTTTRQALDHVCPDQYPSVNERRLEQGWSVAPRNDFLRLFQSFRHMPIVLRDEVSAGVMTAGDLADFVPGIEDRLKGIVDLGGKIGCMGVVPEPQVALVAG